MDGETREEKLARAKRMMEENKRIVFGSWKPPTSGKCTGYWGKFGEIVGRNIEYDESDFTFQFNLHEDDQASIVRCMLTEESSCTECILPEQVEYLGKTYTVTAICDGAFAGTDITALSIPDSIKAIGEGAFASMHDLSTFTGGKGIEFIGKKAFYKCGKLRSITFHEKLRKIEDCAFACSGLEQVVFDSDSLIAGNEILEGTAIKNLDVPHGITEMSSLMSSSRKLETLTVPYGFDINSITMDEFPVLNRVVYERRQ